MTFLMGFLCGAGLAVIAGFAYLVHLGAKSHREALERERLIAAAANVGRPALPSAHIQAVGQGTERLLANGRRES